MTAQEIISTIGLIGLGGLIKSLLDFFIDDRRRKSEAKHLFKEVRYKAIILLDYALINYDTEKSKLLNNRPDIKSKDDLFNEIYTEWVNMALYASDKVIFSMKVFIQNPTEATFTETILAMRKDLYSIKTNIKSKDLKLKLDLKSQ